MKRTKYFFTSLLIFSTPLLVLAAPTLKELMGTAADYLNTALKLLMGLAVLLFVWYVIQYFIRPGDSKKHAEAAQYILWSVIGFFVILSFWGLVNILSSTFNLGPNTPNDWGSVSNLFPK